MLGQALQQTFADLSLGLGYALGIAVIVFLLAGLLTLDYHRVCRRDERQHQSRERFEPVDFAGEIKCHGRAPRDKDYEQVGPAIEPHRGKQRIGL